MTSPNNKFFEKPLQSPPIRPINKRGLLRQSATRIEGNDMTFIYDTQLTEVPRLARHFVLAILLAAPIPSHATLQTPRRPASNEAAQSSPSSHLSNHQRTNRTYLAMVGPAALSFGDTELPLPPEPTMPEPPKPKPDPLKNASVNNPTNAALPPDSTTLKPVTETTDAEPNNNSPKPVSILPDDTRREIRAEDILPYFQPPGGTTDNGTGALPMTVNPPQTPATTPPLSTATYRQQ